MNRLCKLISTNGSGCKRTTSTFFENFKCPALLSFMHGPNSDLIKTNFISQAMLVKLYSLCQCFTQWVTQLGGQFMVRVQCVLWPRGPAEAAPVQAELWEPFHHGPPTALCQLNPTRVHTGVSAQAVLPLGGQL